MQAAARYLAGLAFLEKAICLLGFAVMGASLIFDVLKREITGSGFLGAPQIGVIGMIAVAMVGFGLAAASGAHLRARFFDGLVPQGMRAGLQRFADALTAALLLVLAGLAAAMMAESFALADRTSILRWPIWPMQAIIVFAFAANATRYALFALYPALRPPEDPIPETPENEALAR